MPLTIAWDERAVQFAVFRRGFTCGSLHEKMVLAVGALGCAIIQGRTLMVERTPRLVPVRLTFGGEKSGTVFGVARLERPVRTGLLDSSLPWWWRIIWIHGGHIAIWDARICVHTDKRLRQTILTFFVNLNVTLARVSSHSQTVMHFLTHPHQGDSWSWLKWFRCFPETRQKQMLESVFKVWRRERERILDGGCCPGVCWSRWSSHDKRSGDFQREEHNAWQ